MNRSKFIGGSDVAPILGIHPNRTAVDVWQEKVSGYEPNHSEATLKLFARGKRWEPIAIEMLQDKTEIDVVATNNRYFSKDHEFMSCEIDFEWKDSNGDLQNGEIKTVHPLMAKSWGEEFSDQIPKHYITQALHGLMITGRKTCLFGALIGADDLRIYAVERDEEVIEFIAEQELKFWELVRSHTPPPPANVEDLNKLFQKDNANAISANAEIFAIAEDLRKLKIIQKNLDAKENDLQKKIKEYMQDYAELLSDDGRKLITWRNQVTKRFNQSKFQKENKSLFEEFKTESISRVFRVC